MIKQSTIVNNPRLKSRACNKKTLHSGKTIPKYAKAETILH